jgi:integrase
MEVDLKYLSPEKNRHGKDVLFVRRNGRRIRIREKPGTQEFLDAYKEALKRLCPEGPPQQCALIRQPWPVGTLGWLGTKYFGSDEFQAFDPQSQRNRRNVLEACFEEPYKEDDLKKMGLCPLSALTAQGVKRLRDLKKDKPGAANNRRKYLSSMFGWAIEQTPPLMKSNPARDVRKIKYETEGFHPWTPDQFAQFEKRHPLGTKAHLALGLLIYTGTRRGDMVTLGRQHVRDGWLRFVPSKSRKQTKTVVLSEKPWLPVLDEIVKASPCGDLTFLVTEYGRPFTAAGFGNWFRARCDEAGLPDCSAHGLRKMGATRAAENGATEHQLMAIFDWRTPGQARVYTEKARRKKLAGGSMVLLLADRNENTDCRTQNSAGVAPK